MASPHHHHSCNNSVTTPTTTTATSCCFSCSYNQCCTQTHHPSPPPLNQSPTDPLLNALASLIHQRLQPPPVYTPHVAKPSTQRTPCQNLRFQRQKQYFQDEDQQQQRIRFVLSSLTQRISVLETSIQQLSISSPSNGYYPSYSLRDTAARVIQTHFRAFLVRRSRTLSHLKLLAFIRSSLNSLKSAISNKTYLDPKVVSRKVTDLVLKLDSIQGDDPMIRDGKRSISRDLSRFLDFIEGIGIQKPVSSHKNGRNTWFVASSRNEPRALNDNYSYRDLSVNQMEVAKKLRDRVEKISGFHRVCGNNQEDAELEGFQQFIDGDEEEGINLKVCIDEKKGFPNTRKGISVKTSCDQPNVKKSVYFDENGNAWYHNKDFLFTDQSDSSEDNGEVPENPFDEIGGRKTISLATGSEDMVHLEDGSQWR